jgi:hypothetical protein
LKKRKNPEQKKEKTMPEKQKGCYICRLFYPNDGKNQRGYNHNAKNHQPERRHRMVYRKAIMYEQFNDQKEYAIVKADAAANDEKVHI